MLRNALWISFLAVVSACAAEPTTVDVAATSSTEELVIGGGGPCGTNTCGKGTFCCNPSCGVCAPIGGGCLDVYCSAAEELNMSVAERDDMAFAIGGGGQACGAVTCGKGQHCCNASCSKCVPVGMECTQQTCD